MADRQAQIPGDAYHNDVAEATLYQRQIPGAQFVNEIQQTAAGGFKPYWASRPSQVIGAGVI